MRITSGAVKKSRFASPLLFQSVTRSHQRVNPADITKLPWRWPSRRVQRRIARFLDQKTTLIDNLIAKKCELLQLLAEKRQALISHAVSKGLNQDASTQMHFSGRYIGHIGSDISTQRIGPIN